MHGAPPEAGCPSVTAVAHPYTAVECQRILLLFPRIDRLSTHTIPWVAIVIAINADAFTFEPCSDRAPSPAALSVGWFEEMHAATEDAGPHLLAKGARSPTKSRGCLGAREVLLLDLVPYCATMLRAVDSCLHDGDRRPENGSKSTTKCGNPTPSEAFCTRFPRSRFGCEAGRHGRDIRPKVLFVAARPVIVVRYRTDGLPYGRH
jgi:hypothetical protein